MMREPTQEEREKIIRAIAAGDRIGATSMYISITERGLTEVQKFIKVLTTELRLRNPGKFAKLTKHARADIRHDLFRRAYSRQACPLHEPLPRVKRVRVLAREL